MSRDQAIDCARDLFDNGAFFDLLKRRVAFATQSQEEAAAPQAVAYLEKEMIPYLENLGFNCRLLDNPELPGLPFLAAERREGQGLPTVLIYGHGDTVRAMTEDWQAGLSPWKLIARGQRWYGRGAADNKGQHSLNLAALACVLETRGRLGFNTRVLIEMGEEMGSPGLRPVCARHKDLLAADLLIGSDGPRLTPERPTIYGGTRGVMNFDFEVKLRQGGHHSGNWGGLLANPAVILCNALASIVDQQGKILVPELRPPAMPPEVKKALSRIEVTGEGGPEIDPQWGEPGLSLAQKVYGFNSFEILAMVCGNPRAPAHAIPDRAWARGHLRFVKGSDSSKFVSGLRRHLDANGFAPVAVKALNDGYFSATRLDPEEPWARWAVASLKRTTGVEPAVLPNLGGSLPNDAFTDILGMPTIWVPHSYGGCSQHAPNEHLLASIVREGLAIMAGMFWDLGREGAGEQTD